MGKQYCIPSPRAVQVQRKDWQLRLQPEVDCAMWYLAEAGKERELLAGELEQVLAESSLIQHDRDLLIQHLGSGATDPPFSKARLHAETAKAAKAQARLVGGEIESG